MGRRTGLRHDIALRIRLDRSTFNRRITAICGKDESWRCTNLLQLNMPLQAAFRLRMPPSTVVQSSLLKRAFVQ